MLSDNLYLDLHLVPSPKLHIYPSLLRKPRVQNVPFFAWVHKTHLIKYQSDPQNWSIQVIHTHLIRQKQCSHNLIRLQNTHASAHTDPLASSKRQIMILHRAKSSLILLYK